MVEESGEENRSRRSARQYSSSQELVTRRGGIFWGVVLLIVGTVWLLGTLGYFDLNIDILLPMLVIILGLWLLVTKALG